MISVELDLAVFLEIFKSSASVSKAEILEFSNLYERNNGMIPKPELITVILSVQLLLARV